MAQTQAPKGRRETMKIKVAPQQRECTFLKATASVKQPQQEPTESFDGDRVYDGDDVLPFIVIGSLEDAHCRTRLLADNIRYILNVSETASLLDERFCILDIPLTDSVDFTIESSVFQRAFDFVFRAKQAGSGVLVHCHKGISRSATVVIGLLMHVLDLDFDNAFCRVHEKRERVDPNFGFATRLCALFEGHSTNEFHGRGTGCCAFHPEG